MTNKPMLSVEQRELLGKAASLLEIHGDRPSLETCVADDLRALLDKPAAHLQGLASEVVAFGIQVEKLLCDALGREWSASGISVESLVGELKGKHHGDPVAIFEIDHTGYRARVVLDPEKPFPPTGTKLYAEQPAPLKIGYGVTVENIGFGPEKDRKPYLVFDGGGCLTQVNLIDVSLVSKRQAHTVADLEAVGVRVEHPAPVAVVMPERQADPGPVAGLTRKWAEGWNDALDAVARLNGVKP